MEQVVYDDGGQLVTGSFMDYAMPRAADMPPIRDALLCVPATTNPLGVKGVGEAGTTAVDRRGDERGGRRHSRRCRRASRHARERRAALGGLPARAGLRAFPSTCLCMPERAYGQGMANPLSLPLPKPVGGSAPAKTT